MNKTCFKWYLSIDGGTNLQRVYPIYKSDLAVEYELESGEIFHRAKLSGKIDFVGTDYDWIMSQSLSTATFTLLIRISIDKGTTFTDYWKGIFTLTDMEVYEDDKRIIVQPQVDDRYTTLLDGIETEYDLIKDIAPIKSQVGLLKPPYMQILTAKGLKSSYLYNEYVNNVQGIDSFQEDCSIDEPNELTTTFKFGIIGNAMSAILTKTNDSDGNLPAIDAEGTYVGMYNSSTQSAELNCPNTEYYISYQFVNSAPTSQTIQLHDSNGVILYSAQRIGETPISAFQRNLALYKTESSMVGRFSMSTQAWNMAGRLMCDTDDDTIAIGGQSVNVYNRPIEDVTAYTLNYKRVAPLSDNYMGYVAISARVTDTYTPNVTIYGMNSNGKYYLPPSDNDIYMPISKSTWQGDVSLWVYAKGTNVEVEGALKAYTLNDAFTIDNVIHALLNKIVGNKIIHGDTTDFSQFLYGTNPISGVKERLLLTPKSNVLSSEYSQAAQKGIITLKMVLDMLKKVYQCYWWIEEGTPNKLRIEHISYFMQGKSYVSGSTATIAQDLTTLLNRRNQKAWDFGKNTYTFEKADMPERITFKWMDDEVGSVFTGQPIILQSPFIEKAKKDEQNISNFTSDISRMLIIPNEFSKDGFALLLGIDRNWLRIGNTYTPTNATYPSMVLYADAAGTEITLTLECTNTSGQPQGIEYGLVQDNENNKLGNIPSDATAITSTITIVAPSSEIELYFHTTGNYTGSVKIKDIVGGGTYDGQRTYLYESGIPYLVQNYHLSLQYLLPMFWAYALPCQYASFNGEQAIATSLVERNKTQLVKYPLGNSLDTDPEKLIKTNVGIGSIRKLTVPLSSRVVTATLKQETIEYIAPIIVTPPTLSVQSGEVTLNTQLTISISGNAVSAEYSTDSETWTEYTQPIVLTQDVTIYARAKDANGNTSEVVSAEYEVLPYEAQVEYLQSSGTQYLNIPIQISNTATITIDGFITTTNKELFSMPLNNSYNSNQHQFNIETSATYYRFFTSSSINAGSGNLNTRHLWSCGNSLYRDGTLIGTTTPTQSGARDALAIFRGSHGIVGGSIYSLKFVDGDLELDCIPVRVGTTGYMYDRVSKTLFGNAGTGNFTLGSDVN